VYISPYCRLVLVPPNFMKFGVRGHLTNIITYVKVLVNRFRGYRLLAPQNCHFPLTCCIALTTVYVLPCDTVMFQSSSTRPSHSLSLMGQCSSQFHVSWAERCDRWTRPLLQCTITSTTHLHRLSLINRPQRDGRLSRP